MVDEKAVGLHLLAERERLLDELYRNRAWLVAFGLTVDMDGLEAEYEAQRRKRRPGYPTDIELSKIYAAIRDLLFETGIMPRKRDVAERITRSEDTVDRYLHDAGTTFQETLASLSEVIPSKRRPDKRQRIKH